MRPVIRGVVLTVATAAVLVAEASSGGTVAGPSVTGSISGNPSSGGTLTVTVMATEGGAHPIRLVQAFLLLRSVILDSVSVDTAKRSVTMSSSLPVAVGSGDVAASRFLRLSGRDVSLVARPGALTVVLRLHMIQSAPSGSVFDLAATDDLLRTARVDRPVSLPPAPPPLSNRFSWGSVAVVVLAAMFAGGFVGNLLSTRRSRLVRVSVYDLIRRRLREEKVPQ